MNIETKRLYNDEDIELLPRDKLLEVIDCLFKELESTRNTARSIIEMNKLMRDVRARERNQEMEEFWSKKQKVHLFPERTK